MNAAFGLGPAIGLRPLDQHRRILDAGLFARVEIDQLDLVAALLGPARIHALEHLRPVLAFGAAGARIDFDIGVVVIGLAAQQRRHLVALGLLRQQFQRGGAFDRHRLVALGLRHLDQFGGVGKIGLDTARRRDRFVQSSPLGHHRLRRLGIVPKLGVLDAVVQFIETAKGTIPVKETSSAGQAPAGSDRNRLGLRPAWSGCP